LYQSCGLASREAAPVERPHQVFWPAVERAVFHGQNIAAAVKAICSDRGLWRTLTEGACAFGQEHFCGSRSAAKVAAFYESLASDTAAVAPQALTCSTNHSYLLQERSC
jgi:hypothetical protein